MSMSTTFSLLIYLVTVKINAEYYAVEPSETVQPQPAVVRTRSTDYDPTAIQRMTVSNCSQVLVRRFLKEKCLINNKWYYKCIKSNRFYRVTMDTCEITQFSKVCPNDTTFYQACGHGSCQTAMKFGDLEATREKLTAIYNVIKRENSQGSVYGPKIAVCGEPICTMTPPTFLNPIGNPYHAEYLDSRYSLRGYGRTFNKERWDLERCSPKVTGSFCENEIGGVKVDQYGCEKTRLYQCAPEPPYDFKGKRIGEDSMCDRKCDCVLCDDEAKCHNITVGIFCRNHDNVNVYIQPSNPGQD